MSSKAFEISVSLNVSTRVSPKVILGAAVGGVSLIVA